jgi:hypothetical protein
MQQHDVQVEKDPSKGGYRISYSVTSGNRKKKSVRSFIYVVSSSAQSKQDLIDKSLLKNVFVKLLNEKTESIIWRKKPSEFKTELSHFIRRIIRSNKRGKYLSDFGFGRKEEKEGQGQREGQGVEVGKDGEGETVKRFKDPLLPANKSMFAAEKESANTKVFLAPSFSGKTTLMVNELNKMTPKELAEFDKILLFTESVAAAPLKMLNKRVREKMLILDRFTPQFVRILKKINTITKNRFRFLLLLDDCLNLKGNMLVKLILTLRNANISTVICIQYSKLLSKSSRQSIHDYYILNMKMEDLEYLMTGFLSSHFRDLFEREGMDTKENINKMNYKKLAEKAMERLKGKILHFDQRHDQILIYDRGYKDTSPKEKQSPPQEKERKGKEK